MKIKYFLLLSIVFGISFVACSNTEHKKDIDNKKVNVTPTKKEINSVKAYDLIKKDPSIIILDVRTPREFNQGHVKGAININVVNQDFAQKIKKLSRDKTYLVYCRTHNRSSVAVKYMLKNDFKNIFQMVDGFSGWVNNNLPY